MGLDMYAFRSTKPELSNYQTDPPEEFRDEMVEMQYWRKHPNLHGWMQELYYSKDGKDPDFNLSWVRLELNDLMDLKNSIFNEKLPETSGFFFGQSDGSERDEDIEFVKKAIAAVQAGETIWYTSWW